MAETINTLAESARYTTELDNLLFKLGGLKEVLHLDYESSWSGYVNLHALLNDDRVLVYNYYYGSCSGCDEWEHRGLSDEEVVCEMEKEAVIYPDITAYQKYKETLQKS